MALPTSGEISFSNFRTEFGDSGEIRMSDMYRGGPFVDATIGGTTTIKSYGPAEGPFASIVPTRYGWEDLASNYYANTMWWADQALFQISWTGGLKILPVTVESFGFRYRTIGTQPAITESNGDKWYLTTRESITFQTINTTVNVNTNVPTASQIGWNQLRGAINY